MNILITNDDGWGSNGLKLLIEKMHELGHVTVVAPDGPRSGQSNAITVTTPLRLKRIETEYSDVDVFVSNGTPTDCVKLAIEVLLKDNRPDVVVSGINHGSNSAINVIYSGTMGAVFVAAENGIPAIGFSITDHHSDADFSQFGQFILPLTKLILSLPHRYGLCYNINAPIGEIKGVKVTRQCKGYWHKEFKEYIDPNGAPFYMLTGEFLNTEPESTDTDEWALNNHYISVTPSGIDTTASEWETIGKLSVWNGLTNIG